MSDLEVLDIEEQATYDYLSKLHRGYTQDLCEAKAKHATAVANLLTEVVTRGYVKYGEFESELRYDVGTQSYSRHWRRAHSVDVRFGADGREV